MAAGRARSHPKQSRSDQGIIDPSRPANQRRSGWSNGENLVAHALKRRGAILRSRSNAMRLNAPTDPTASASLGASSRHGCDKKGGSMTNISRVPIGAALLASPSIVFVAVAVFDHLYPADRPIWFALTAITLTISVASLKRSRVTKVLAVCYAWILGGLILLIGITHHVIVRFLICLAFDIVLAVGAILISGSH
jgi:hypothetical protein